MCTLIPLLTCFSDDPLIIDDDVVNVVISDMDGEVFNTSGSMVDVGVTDFDIDSSDGECCKQLIDY